MLDDWYRDNVSPDMLKLRAKMIRLLQEEEKLNEIARTIKKGFLQQNALHKDDTYVSLEKQYKMLCVIDTLYTSALKCVKKGIPLSTIRKQRVFDDVIKMKYDVPNDQIYLLDELSKKIVDTYQNLREKYE